MFIIRSLSKPTNCLNCPCLWTLSEVPSETGATFDIRYCAAAQQDIMVYPHLQLPSEWSKFEIPSFCPVEED